MAIYKNNTVKNALEKLSSCETLRKKCMDMLEKCGPVNQEITLADKMFLMCRIVEKQMHSRQTIEIKPLDLQPKIRKFSYKSSNKGHMFRKFFN